MLEPSGPKSILGRGFIDVPLFVFFFQFLFQLSHCGLESISDLLSADTNPSACSDHGRDGFLIDVPSLLEAS